MRNWRVRFVDFPAEFADMEDRIMGTISATLAAGDLMLRQQLADFEASLAAFVGTKHAVGVSNCTDGLRLTLRALGVGPSDEVITVAHTFVATAAAIHHNGATPVLNDVGADHNMDVDLLEAAITPRTKAVIPVHLNGRLCDMERISEVCADRDILVVEDSAQALGASLNGRRGGSWGVAGAFSFYPAKMLGAYGDAGAVTTDDPELDHQLRLLRDHGRATKSDLDGWGFNCRLDNLQAALLDLKLPLLPSWIERRREIASLYDGLLVDVPDVVRPPAPADGPYYDVFQNYVIEAERRDELHAHLAARGVETLISWPKPMHKQNGLGLDHFQLPRTEALCDRVISLPITTQLRDDQIEYVAEVIKDFYV